MTEYETEAEADVYRKRSRRNRYLGVTAAIAGMAAFGAFLAREIAKDAALCAPGSVALNPANQNTLDAFGYEAIHSYSDQSDRVTLRLHIDHNITKRVNGIRITPNSIAIMYDGDTPEQVIPIAVSKGRALVDLKLISYDEDPFFWTIVDVVNDKRRDRELEVIVSEGPKTDISAKMKNARVDRGVYLFLNTQDVEANHTQISQLSHVNMHVGLTREQFVPLERVANTTRLVPLQGKYHMSPDGLTRIPDPFPVDQYLSLYNAGAYNANLGGNITHDVRNRASMEWYIDSVKRNRTGRGR